MTTRVHSFAPRAAALAAFMWSAVSCTAVGTPSPSATTVGPVSATSVVSPSVRITGPVLGPDGFGPLKMGMTLAQAKSAAPGLQPVAVPTGSCPLYRVAGAKVLFNRQSNLRNSGGIAVITPSPVLPTASGIRIGETWGEVRANFPYAHQNSVGGAAVRLRALVGTRIEYAVDFNGLSNDGTLPSSSVVTGTSLELDQACFD